MAFANRKAKRLSHEFLNTEHMLWGLVEEGAGVGAYVLKNLDVDFGKVRWQLEKRFKYEPERVLARKLPQTPLSKKVIECALEECRELGHNYCGTEHMLLGLMRVDRGVAYEVLLRVFNLRLEEVRAEVLDVLWRSASGADSDADADPKSGS